MREIIRTRVYTAAAGVVLIGLLDAAIGLMVKGPPLGTAGSTLIFALAAAGDSALLAPLAVASLLLSLAAAAAVRRCLPRRSRAACESLVLLVLALVVFHGANATLFQGGGISRHPLRGVFEWVFRILGTAGVGGAVLILFRVVRRADGSTARVRLCWAAPGLAAAVMLLLANARFLPGQYPLIHFQLVLGAAVLVLAAVRISAGPGGVCRPGSARAAVAVALVLVAGAAGVRRLPAFEATRAAVAGRALVAREWNILTGPVYALFDRSDPPLSDIPAEIPGPDQWPAAWREAFDRTLPPGFRPNILWISIDTLRADHMSLYGYRRPTTPRMDSLAQGSFVFDRASAPYPTSAFSYSSALTGLAPRVTPAYAAMYGKPLTHAPGTTLPEILGERGFSTVAVTAFNREVSNNEAMFGTFRRGFRVYNPDQTLGNADGTEVAASAAKVLRTIEEPFFLWVHFLDPHDPYEDRPGIDFGDDLVDRYDEEIAHADRQAGAVIDALRERRLLDRTVIVFFSDHGEEFNERGGRYHNSSVYDEQIRVPLVIRVPGLPGGRIAVPAGLLDLLPTTTALLRLSDSLERHGRELVSLMLGCDDGSARHAYSEWFGMRGTTHVRDQRAVVQGTMKLIARPQQAAFELYDLASDPEEYENLIGHRTEEARRLRGLLAALDARIDAFSGRGTGALERPVAGQIDGFVSDLVAGRAVDEACGGIVQLLQDSYGDRTPPARAAFDEAAWRRLLERLLGLLRDGNSPGLVRLLPLFRDPAAAFAVADLRSLAHRGGGWRTAVAHVLAGHGDGTLKDALVESLGDPAAAVDAALGLLEIGEVSGFTHLAATLAQKDGPRVVRLLRAAARVDHPLLSRAARFFFWKEPLLSWVVQDAGLRGFGARNDPDAAWIMARLARSADLEIRRRARERLESLAGGEDAASELGDVVDRLVAGDGSALYRRYEEALDHYKAAVERRALPPADARFRRARMLHILGRTEEARRELETVQRESADPLDRETAERRVRQLAESPVLDPSAFGAEVTEGSVTAPSRVIPWHPFTVTLRLRNTGRTAWPGGAWVHQCEVGAVLEDPDGNLLKPAGWAFENVLPEGGVEPGEEVPLILGGTGPESRGTWRLAITFRQRRAPLEAPRVIWRRPEPFGN